MSTLDEAWDDVGEQFKRLGRLWKDHYGAQDRDDAAAVSEEEVAQAIDVLGESIRSAVGAAGDTIKDPELKEEARRAAGSLFNAIGLTFEEIASQITRPKGESASSTPEPPDAEADDSETDDAEDTDY